MGTHNQRWPWWAAAACLLCAMLPALATLVLSGAAAGGIGAARSASEPVSLLLVMAVELTAVVAVSATCALEPDIR